MEGRGLGVGGGWIYYRQGSAKKDCVLVVGLPSISTFDALFRRMKGIGFGRAILTQGKKCIVCPKDVQYRESCDEEIRSKSEC